VKRPYTIQQLFSYTLIHASIQSSLDFGDVLALRRQHIPNNISSYTLIHAVIDGLPWKKV
jgi:hypothetical protein